MQLLPQSSWYSETGTKTTFWVDGFFKMVLEIIWSMRQGPLAIGWSKASDHLRALKKYQAHFVTWRGERPKGGIPKEGTQSTANVHFNLNRRIPRLCVMTHTVNTKAGRSRGRAGQGRAGSAPRPTSAATSHFLSAVIFKTLFYNIWKHRLSLIPRSPLYIPTCLLPMQVLFTEL